jgi:hypothetical protein
VSPHRVRWWIAASLVALAGAVGAAWAPAGPAATGTRVVMDAAGRFEVAIPSSWEVRAAQGGRGGAMVTAEPLPHPMPAQARGAAPARRDLFALPEGAAPPPGRGRAAALPPVPSAGGVPLPPLPPGVPALPAPLPSGGSGRPEAPSPSALPPRLAAVILGPSPQAVLAGADGAYLIVRRSDRTPWGTVAAIRASGVVLKTESGAQTISWRSP